MTTTRATITTASGGPVPAAVRRGLRPAPLWVLFLGAALLAMALLLTAYGPRQLTPTATRSVGTVSTSVVSIAPASSVAPNGN